MSADPSRKRLVGIDVLRGSAALMVLFYHALGAYILMGSDSPVAAVLASPIILGFAGVHLFLVLSGFCIHLPMAMRMRDARAMRLDQRAYWKRRFRRLYPAYFVAMIFSAAFAVGSSMWLANNYSAAALVGELSDIKWDFTSHLFMGHLFSIHHAWGLSNGAFWSLALEAQLYLLYPLLLVMRNRMSLLRVLGYVLAITMAWRAFGVWVWGAMDWGNVPDKSVEMFVILHAPARWFEWALGFAAAEVYARGTKLPAWCRSWRLAVALFAGAAVVRQHDVGRWLVDPVWGISFFMVTNAMIARERRADLKLPGVWKPIAAVGVISYSLYLIHCPILRGSQYLMYNFDIPTIPAMGFYILMALVCIALAYPFYRLFERPFMSMRPRVSQPTPMPRRRRVAAALPRISVVTPSYNQADFLDATIRSVLDQRYPNLQYGIVDGNSSDGSTGIIQTFRGQLDFAIIEPDRGQVDALNKGLRRADGEIICFINSDDTLLPGCLHTVGRYFAEHPGADWLIGDCVMIDTAGRRLEACRATDVDDLAHALVRDKPFNMPQPSIFWRRSLLDRFGLFREELEYCFDFEMWCRFLLGGVKLHRIDAELATYRLHGASKTCALRHKQLWDHILIEREYARHLPLPRRVELIRGIGYRTRQHLVATATRRPWGTLVRRPWWIGSQQVRELLWRGPAARAA